MNRDELLALGLTDEQAGAVLQGFPAPDADLAARLAAAEAEIALRDKRDAVLDALQSCHARDPRLLLRLIDMEKITLREDGVPEGLDAQLEALRRTAPYLFTDSPDPVGGTAAAALSPADFDMNAFLRGE